MQPGAIVKTLQLPMPRNASVSGDAPMMLRFGLDNPIFLAEESAEAAETGLPTNQWFYTVGSGDKYQNPKWLGWWMSVDLTDEFPSPITGKMTMHWVFKHKFAFKGLRMSPTLGTTEGYHYGRKLMCEVNHKPNPYEFRYVLSFI